MSYKRSFSKERTFQCQYHVDDEMVHPFADQFFQKIKHLSLHTDIVIVCIGTDRSTGDSFGPLTGTMITENSPRSLDVYGTLHHPVHALNLQETINHIMAEYRQPLIIAIDASMGKPQNVGRITFASGPVSPGSAVNKQLPDIGHMHITATVNVGGMMEYFVLQNTRLNLVMKLAERTSEAILKADRWLYQPPSTATPSRRHHSIIHPSAQELSAPSNE
ncbi:spore protease YyaC [Natribacillus halophilus]|uniref:Putative sporulation protein YyaC n=1 Tax=Natribacillus halophilus TaxID=549003 RepID=A0A1G8L202_9BACI|nr:spore protease YyaC [Natribacillus halophilus]SDI49705.1 putative sporulation protein YyaC [Natribacillus halophilus]